MRALILHSADGLDAARLEEVATPEPAAGEVRVALRAAALNHRELWIARGQYPGMALPSILGADGAGIIDAVGPGVDPGRLGQAVLLYPGLGWGDDPDYPSPLFGLLGMPGPGTICGAVCVPAASAVAKPPHLDFAQAAALPLAGLTAWRGLMTKAGLKAGERLLVTGVGGGVATFALLFGVAMGAEVFVTSGSEVTLAKAQTLGARAGFNYKDEGWRKALGRQAGGIDVVFDGAPAASYPGYGRALAMGARVVVYGSTGGTSFPVNAPELFLKNLRLMGTNVGNPAEFAAMVGFIGDRRLVPAIDQRFPLANATDALACLEQGHGFGKIIIDIDGE
ncbi:zinc-binding dehydrogenase [Niveispirillum sp. KHB5.9]|uniref:zinc-binding dehydrogenase n=1 Tax=Niveispirillum sp. KHB5.9 TaxID=3400269 RepID=UPI003A84B1AF